MNAEPGKERRQPKLGEAESEAAARPWQVRTTDGVVRGPFGLMQLKALVEVEILTPDAMIAPAGGDEWLPLKTHAVWAALRAEKTKLFLRGGVPSPAVPEPVVAEADLAATPAMQERMAAMRKREEKRLLRGIVLSRVAQGVRWIREGLVFLCFLTLGDLVRSFFGESLGMYQLCALLAVLAVATAYYSFRAFAD